LTTIWTAFMSEFMCDLAAAQINLGCSATYKSS
jgi:hypothetical protein